MSSDLEAIDAQLLIDALRRNLLYQTPEIILKSDGKTAAASVVRILPEDYFTIMKIIRAQSGWDLSESDKEELMSRSSAFAIEHLQWHQDEIADMDVGTLLHMLQSIVGNPDYQSLEDAIRRDIARRSGYTE